jgi:hypothetical protein
MATKNNSTPPQNKPTRPPAVRQDSIIRKTNDGGGRILGESQQQTTVFQTRPTPPDPNKK